MRRREFITLLSGAVVALKRECQTFLDAWRAAIFYCAGARKFTCFLVA
jgi:hypothetical protein